MRSESCLPFSPPAPACHSHPYRGGMGGKLKQCASVPVTPKGSGKLASLAKSITYGACPQSSLPTKSSLPPHRTTTNVRQAQKPTVSRARIGYQQANEMAANLIAANPALYPEGSLPALWADVVLSKAAWGTGRF